MIESPSLISPSISSCGSAGIGLSSSPSAGMDLSPSSIAESSSGTDWPSSMEESSTTTSSKLSSIITESSWDETVTGTCAIELSEWESDIATCPKSLAETAAREKTSKINEINKIPLIFIISPLI